MVRLHDCVLDARAPVQATHGIRTEVDSQHHVLDRMVRGWPQQGISCDSIALGSTELPVAAVICNGLWGGKPWMTSHR